MHKTLLFAENAFALLVLFFIISVAAVSVLTLSPIAVGSKSAGNVAGIDKTSTGEILSNEIPLELKDLNQKPEERLTQLIKYSDNEYSYHFSLFAQKKGTTTYPMLSLTNFNTTARSVTFAINISEQAGTNINVTLKGEESFRLHSSNDYSHRTVAITIPANSTKEFSLEVEYLQNIAFPVQGSVEISY